MVIRKDAGYCECSGGMTTKRWAHTEADFSVSEAPAAETTACRADPRSSPTWMAFLAGHPVGGMIPSPAMSRVRTSSSLREMPCSCQLPWSVLQVI